MIDALTRIAVTLMLTGVATMLIGAGILGIVAVVTAIA